MSGTPELNLSVEVDDIVPPLPAPPDAVILSFITTTTVNVIGLGYIVAT
jgi:hypothetical protein